MARPGDAVRRAGVGGNIGTALAAGIQDFGPYLQAHLQQQDAERKERLAAEQARRKETLGTLEALGHVPVEDPIAQMLGLEGPRVTLPGFERPRTLAETPDPTLKRWLAQQGHHEGKGVGIYKPDDVNWREIQTDEGWVQVHPHTGEKRPLDLGTVRE